MPEKPTAEKDPRGKPTLSLWASDQGAILQLGTRWEAEDRLLGELKKLLAEQFKLEPVLIRLSPVPISIDKVTLALGSGDGRFTELQTTLSSGYPPYAAIFNVQLTAEQKARAVAALNGRQGFLTVTYRGSAPLEVSAETTIEGDVKTDLARLGKNPSLAECQAQIDIAIAEGRLNLKQSESHAAAAEIRKKADRMAKEKAAAVLLRMSRGMDPIPTPECTVDESRLKVTASLKETLSLPIDRSTDVSSWFPSGAGMDHVQVTASTIKDPATSQSGTSVVRLGFDGREAPIAFIQVTAGEARGTLRPPSFDPVTLSGSAKPLVVKTSYKDGGPPFETTLQSPGPQGWTLSPKDLGLAQIVLDASARRRAGSTHAQVRVRYKPSARGTADEQMINLRYGDWIETWYVITRSADLGGLLEFEWKETTADGSVVKHPPAATDNPELKL